MAAKDVKDIFAARIVSFNSEQAKNLFMFLA